MNVVDQIEFETAKELFDFLKKVEPPDIGILSEKEIDIESYIHVTAIRCFDCGKSLFMAEGTGKIQSIKLDVLVINKEILLAPEYIIFRIEEPDEGTPEYFLYSSFIYINRDDNGKPTPIKMMNMN